MKKRFYEILNLVLFVLGLYLIEPQTTGAMIGVLPHTLNSTTGIILILISGIIFVANEGIRKRMADNIAKKFLKQRHIPETHRELVIVARKMGYDIEPGGKHATNIRIKTASGYQTITSVPYSLTRNTSRRILKTLDEYFPQVS